MGTHPNAILMAVLKVNGTTRKTVRALQEAYGKPSPHDDDLVIGGTDYHVKAMEYDYDEGWQISAAEGDIVVFDLVTYGYGEYIPWDKLAAQQKALEQWCQEVSTAHNLESFDIRVSANYW